MTRRLILHDRMHLHLVRLLEVKVDEGDHSLLKAHDDRDLLKIVKAAVEGPLRMIIHCPECGTQHVDAGVWAEKEHWTHQCQRCGHEWKAAKVATVGVASLDTKGTGI